MTDDHLARLSPAGIVPGLPPRLRLVAAGQETLPADRLAAVSDGVRAADAEALERMAAAQRAFRERAWLEACPVQFRAAVLDGLDGEHQDKAGLVSGFLDSPDALVLLLAGRGERGKSHAAYAVGHAAYERGLWAAGYMFTDLLADLRPSSVDETRHERARETLRRADVLIVDELGAEAVSPFTTQVLGDTVQGRLSLGLRTVVTTNLGERDLLDRYGSRIVSKLVRQAAIVRFDGPARRAAPLF